MAPKPLRKRWRRALKNNVARTAELARRRGPLNAGAVHDLRVALRRSRLLLQLDSKHHDRNRIKRYRATARKVMDAFAPPRDADVTLDWAKQAQAPPALLSHLLRERARLCRRAERTLKKLKPGLRPARIKAVRKLDVHKLSRRFHRWLDALAARCQTDVQRARTLTVPGLHALRRDIRRWRYLRELATGHRPAGRDRLIRALISAQESLGRIQDAEVILRQLQTCQRSREVIELKRELLRDQEACREAALAELDRLAQCPAFIKA